MSLAKVLAAIAAACLVGCGGGGTGEPPAAAAPVGAPCTLAAGQGWCWQHSDPTRDISFWYIWFVDGASGFVAASDGVLRKTTDGGRQWVEQRLPDSPAYGGSLQFTPEGTGFTVAQGRLYRIAAPGSAWEAMSLPGVAGTVRWTQFIDANHGWLTTWTCTAGGDIISCDSNLYATENGGATWQPRGTYDDSVGFAFADRQVGIRSQFDGLHRTTDSGRTWSKVASADVAGSLSARLYFRTPMSGWNLGSGSGSGRRVLRTNDAGQTWTPVTLPAPLSPFEQYYDIRFGDADHGWIVGTEGTVLRTSNGGANWRRQPTGTTLPLFSVFALDKDRAWVTGARGTVLATSTGGE